MKKELTKAQLQDLINKEQHKADQLVLKAVHEIQVALLNDKFLCSCANYTINVNGTSPIKADLTINYYAGLDFSDLAWLSSKITAWGDALDVVVSQYNSATTISISAV